MEISTPGNGDGNYPLADGEPRGPEEATWIYEAEERESFNAPFISGAVRLENGNTLTCSGPQGRFFEVTPDGEIVWEYLSPYHGNVPGWCFRHQVLLRGCGQWYRCGRDRVASPSEQENLDPRPQGASAITCWRPTPNPSAC